ncbi:MAG: hypothetical protein IPL73_21990 [Candidatus Obscuribacter sp.]|nr:hypothetical protein [Candidatus Obscuribacter sp.]
MASGNVEQQAHNPPAGADQQREVNDRSKPDNTLPNVDRVDLMKSGVPANTAQDAQFLKGFELTGNKQDGMLQLAVAGSRDNVFAPGADSRNSPFAPGTDSEERGLILAGYRDKTGAPGRRNPNERSDAQVAVREVEPGGPPQSGDKPSRTYEIQGLRQNAGLHGNPDAVVRVPENFDPAKPINLVVYNHGQGNTVSSSLRHANIEEQMRKAPPNTVLVMPEWQTKPGSTVNSMGGLDNRGAFDAMINQALQRTPGLSGKGLSDVKDVTMIGHSAGGYATNLMLGNNEIGKKVKDLVLIDTVGQSATTNWIGSHLKDFANGDKHLTNVSASYMGNSRKQAENVQDMLKAAKLPESTMAKDFKNGKALDPAQLNKHSMVFNYSNELTPGRGGPHGSMPSIYIGRALEAQKLRGEQAKDAPAPAQMPARPESRTVDRAAVPEAPQPARKTEKAADELPVAVPSVTYEPVSRPKGKPGEAPVAAPRPVEVPRAPVPTAPPERPVVQPPQRREVAPPPTQAETVRPGAPKANPSEQPSLRDIMQGKVRVDGPPKPVEPAPQQSKAPEQRPTVLPAKPLLEQQPTVREPIKPEINRSSVAPNALDGIKFNEAQIKRAPNEVVTSVPPRSNDAAPVVPRSAEPVPPARPLETTKPAEAARTVEVPKALEKPAQPGSLEERSAAAKKALEAPDASIKQKIEALNSLYKDGTKDAHGRVHVTLNDAGKEREFQIGKQDIGKNAHLIQMYAKDSSGRTHPVLRAVERGDQIEKQRASSGREASYSGDWWSQHNRESSVSKVGMGAKLPAARVEAPAPVQRKEAPAPVPAPAARVEAPAPVQRKEAPAPVPAPAARVEAQAPVQRKEAPAPVPAPAARVEAQAPAPRVEQTKPQQAERPEVQPDKAPQTTEAGMGKVTRTAADRRSFYNHQDDGKSCSAFAMGMLHADQVTGRPMNYGRETHSFKELAGVTNHGYRGTLETMANQLRSLDLKAKAYDYGFGNVGPKAMQDLNKELDQGRSAVAKVINPHTGNAHYIYIAGRDSNGRYIIGDPDRHNNSAFGHDKPVEPERLMRMMGPRNGFVVAWSDNTAQTRMARSR